MKILKLLITGLVLTTTIVAAGLVHAQADVTVTFDVESVAEIDPNTCSSNLEIDLILNSSGYDSGSDNCEFIIKANAPWDLTFKENDDISTGLTHDYEANMLYNQAYTNHPHIISDCIESGTPPTCDLTTAPTYSEWGVWFTDGATGTQTLNPTPCNSMSSACAVESTDTQIFNEQTKTAIIGEGVNIHVYAYANYQVQPNTGYIDSIEISLFVD